MARLPIIMKNWQSLYPLGIVWVFLSDPDIRK